MKVGAVESTMCLAPSLRSISACWELRTILTRSTPSLRQILLSIWPRLEAAAVCTSALWPSRRMVSTMPSDVSGLTKHDAPSAGVMPAGSTRQSPALSVRYCANIAPPMIATVLPIRAFAASDDPVLITTPAPSLPTGRDSSSRPAIMRIAASGTFAVMTGASLVPDALAEVISAAPTRRARSDGLIGAASTRTKTWSAEGSAIGTLASDISSSPLFLISERSSSPVLPSEVIGILPVSAAPNWPGVFSGYDGNASLIMPREKYVGSLRPAPLMPPCPHISPGFPIPARSAATDCISRCDRSAPMSRF